MLNKEKKLYSLDDVAIQPAFVSTIKHRDECNPFDKNGYLPVFTSPMPCVINMDNYETFNANRIIPIIPRTVPLKIREKHIWLSEWVALSLDEAETLFNKIDSLYIAENASDLYIKILIDIANGNMSRLFDIVSSAKEKCNSKLQIMIGNIANPETIVNAALCGADYVRCSVGSGSACCTSKFTGVFYPMASLISDCDLIRRQNGFKIKIVADGGIYEYRDIIKCIALGADYVMLGNRLAACEDSAAETILMENGKRAKLYYGMASNIGMEKLGKSGYPEGTSMYIDIKSKISDFSNELNGYLKSAMSYCGCRDLKEMRTKSVVNVISGNASKRFS